MSETTKTKKRFNIIDLIVLVVLIAAVAFVGIKFFGGNSSQSETYYLTFYAEEVPSFVADYLTEGDPVFDESLEEVIGTVVSYEINESVSYTTNDGGQIVNSAKDGYNSVKVTAVVQASEFSNGIIINSTRYGVGHSMTMRAGDAKMYVKVYSYEKVDKTDTTAEVK